MHGVARPCFQSSVGGLLFYQSLQDMNKGLSHLIARLLDGAVHLLSHGQCLPAALQLAASNRTPSGRSATSVLQNKMHPHQVLLLQTRCTPYDDKLSLRTGSTRPSQHVPLVVPDHWHAGQRRLTTAPL